VFAADAEAAALVRRSFVALSWEGSVGGAHRWGSWTLHKPGAGIGQNVYFVGSCMARKGCGQGRASGIHCCGHGGTCYFCD
jgi:hypothetical protein